MFIYPEIDPIAIRIGPSAVAWYGSMYFMAFIAAYF
ncbi:MAG: prolipoprotein diacylglyceryl transferase, partial [Candidatus Marinimicrobia bacterium]|nr:prolipoprotein diacylglyceryl transferase [Candidatus Neomarinimicrobiota bacterium]